MPVPSAIRVWGERVFLSFPGREGGDPSSVVFDAIKKLKKKTSITY